MVETPNYAAAALLLPPVGLLLLALLGLALLPRRRRLGIALCTFSVVALLICSMPVVALALMRSLEAAPLADARAAKAQAIVILGGGRNRSALEYGGVTVSAFALGRLRYGARLARETGLPVLVTGGQPDGEGPPEAQLMRGILENELNVPVRWSEGASRTTRDSARLVAAQLEPQGIRRILLVTDAWHMPRALPEFARHGFDPVPAPMGYIGARPFNAYQLVPTADSLRLTHIALREWLGMLVYRARA
jgi:uncharacterized SAM-binding protein YcdF (DUF218 family)